MKPLLIVLIALIAYRGGVTAGLLSAALAAALLLGSSAFLTEGGFTAANAVENISFTISFVVVGYLVGRMRDRWHAARGVQHMFHAEVVDADERLVQVLESVTDGFATLDSNWRLTYVNRRAERILGRARQHLLGRNALDVFPEGVGSRIHKELEHARDEHEPIEFESWYAPNDRWFGIRAYPADDGGLTVYFRDITRRKHAEESLARVASDATARQAEQNAQRLLAEAGAALAATLDYEHTLTTLLDFVVPALADCCIIDVVEPEGNARRIVTAWSPALGHTGADRLLRRAMAAAPSGAGLLAESSEPVLISSATKDVVKQLTADPNEQGRLAGAHIQSVIVTPLNVGNRKLGTMTAVAITRSYDQADLSLLTELARRAAFAIDNAVLYETAHMANQSKSDFLAVMSHELRTPLTTVMGYTDLLLAGVTAQLTQQSQTYVERIRMAAWHLLGLIEQILIYARLEVGREQVHVEKVNIARVMREAADLIEPVASEKGLHFKLVEPPADAVVETDATKLRQILLNLLSNAVKFTDSGNVDLEVRVGDAYVQFMVHDTGVGIAPEHQHRVFDSFWQVDQSATRKEGGTGIGLSVSRKLAHLLGGDITVRSVPRQGTTFTVSLPRAGLTRAVSRP
jgi:PAS domain S-box-containing protein